MSLLQTARKATSWPPELFDFQNELKQILSSPSSPKGPSSTQIFFLAMAFGFSKGYKGEKPPRKGDGARLEYFHEDEVARMRMIAIAETGSSEVLESDDDVIDIAEQYAAGGLVLLRSEKETNPSFREWLISQLFLEIESFVSSK